MNLTQEALTDAVDLDAGRPGESGDLGVAAAHYLDVVRANARRRLDTGESPDHVMADVSDSVLDWLIAREHPRYETLGRTARFIYLIERRVRERIGAEHTSAWFVCPNPALDGRTPVEDLVNHRHHNLAEAVRRLKWWHRPSIGHFGDEPLEDDRSVTDIGPDPADETDAEDTAAPAERDPADQQPAPDHDEEGLQQAARDLGIDPDALDTPDAPAE